MKDMKQSGKKIRVISAILAFAVMITSYGFTSYKKTENNRKPAKYAMLVRTLEHVNASIETARQMREAGRSFDAFEVIICGEVVGKLKDDESIPGYLKEGRMVGVSFSVCGMSLKQLQVDPRSLPDGFKTVENGIIRLFDLQDQGYQTVEF